MFNNDPFNPKSIGAILSSYLEEALAPKTCKRYPEKQLDNSNTTLDHPGGLKPMQTHKVAIAETPL